MQFATDRDGDVWAINEHGEARLFSRGEMLTVGAGPVAWAEAKYGPLEIFAELAMPEPPSQCNAPGGQS